MFTVELFNRQDSPVPIPAQLTAKPLRWSARAIGGPEQAEIELRGDLQALWRVLQWMRFTVHIRNPEGALVWWGYVHEAVVDMGGVTVGLTLETMYNYIRCLYSYEDADGALQDAMTDAAYASSSIDTFGQKELQHSAGETEQSAAEQLANTILNWHKYPMPLTEGGGGEARAVLRCRGWWETLGWTYWANPLGREQNDVASNVEHMLGWGIAAHNNKIGFRDGKIGDLDMRLGWLIPGNQVRVSGAFYAGNNDVFTVESPGEADDPNATTPTFTPTSYTSDGIGFESSDDIYDTLSGLDFIRVGTMITTSGSSETENNDTWWVSKISQPNHWIEVEEHTITTINDATDNAITVKQGHHATFNDATFTREVVSPSNNITLTGVGSKLVQVFELATATGWTIGEARIRARKVGSPADNLQLAITTAAGTWLASASIAGSAIDEEMQWLTFDLGAGATVSGSGTTYKILIQRTGAEDYDDFYVIGLEDGLLYTRGALTLYDSITTSWVTRAPDCDLPFQLWGVEETTVQLESMFDANEFAAGADITADSGVYDRQYRDGYTTTLDEATALLEMGDSTNARLLSTVTPMRWFRVLQEPTQSLNVDLQLAADGRLLRPDGQPIARGSVPAGQWARIQNLPTFDMLESVSPLMLERVEYDAEADKHFFDARGAPSMETMPLTLRQG